MIEHTFYEGDKHLFTRFNDFDLFWTQQNWKSQIKLVFFAVNLCQFDLKLLFCMAELYIDNLLNIIPLMTDTCNTHLTSTCIIHG